jgi:hypothetical protein
MAALRRTKLVRDNLAGDSQAALRAAGAFFHKITFTMLKGAKFSLK